MCVANQLQVMKSVTSSYIMLLLFSNKLSSTSTKYQAKWNVIFAHVHVASCMPSTCIHSFPFLIIKSSWEILQQNNHACIMFTCGERYIPQQYTSPPRQHTHSHNIICEIPNPQSTSLEYSIVCFIWNNINDKHVYNVYFTDSLIFRNWQLNHV